MNAKCASCKNFWGSSEEMKWDGYSIICKYCPERENMLRKHCVQCERLFCAGDMIFYTDSGYGMFICQNCAKKENFMPNIKITAEVDGKQVPLETISTETFEAIKALGVHEEIPVARLADYSAYNLGNKPRLLFKPTKDINLRIGKKTSVHTIYR